MPHARELSQMFMDNMKKTAVVALLVAGVSTGVVFAKAKSEWVLKGAVRSESLVTLSFVSKEQALSPEDHQAAVEVAAKHCATWGLSGAELNGEIQRTCAGRSRFGKCKRWEFTMPLQCRGENSAGN